MSSMRHACCRVCGATTEQSILEASEMMFALGGTFEYGQCTECGSLSLIDVPANLADYYPANYYSYTRTNRTSRGGQLAALLLRQLPDAILRRVVLRIHMADQIMRARSDVRGWLGHSTAATRILDVGCGSGFSLTKYHYAGYMAEGCDPFYTGPDPVEFPVHRLPLSALNRRYDVIMFNHSLEHVADPRADLASAADLLLPDGVCVIAIPKLPSAAFSQYGANWFSLDAPRHLFIPSVRGLSDLARQLGLRVVSVTEEPVMDNHLWSEIYSRGQQYQDQSIQQWLTYTEIEEIRERAMQAMGSDRCCHATFVLRKAI